MSPLPTFSYQILSLERFCFYSTTSGVVHNLKQQYLSEKHLPKTKLTRCHSVLCKSFLFLEHSSIADSNISVQVTWEGCYNPDSYAYLQSFRLSRSGVKSCWLMPMWLVRGPL